MPGFYTTYEELKLKNVNPAGPTIKSFYSTYEELKLEPCFLVPGTEGVFTVPMRN